MTSQSPLAPLGGASDTMSALAREASRLGTTLDATFMRAATQGRQFDSVLKSVEKSLLSLAVRMASRQIETGLASLFSGKTGAGSGINGAVIPFASGGIVTAPTVFGMAARGALTGEAGPEAILPLQRGPDGALGLRGGGATTVHVTVHAQDIESFRRSEAQLAASLTRALQRGRRAM